MAGSRPGLRRSPSSRSIREPDAPCKCLKTLALSLSTTLESLMKILHTSDWHVGSNCAQYGEVAARVRAHRMDAVRRLPDLARTKDAGLVLVAGDLFDSPSADEETVAQVVEVLNRFAPARVVVIPGNHDVHEPGGVWDRRSWKDLGEIGRAHV